MLNDEPVSDAEMERRMKNVETWEAMRSLFSDLTDEEIDEMRDCGKTVDLFRCR